MTQGSKQEVAVRARLDELIRERQEDYASLSRLLGRNAAYIQQFIKRGIPRKLGEDDRRLLAERLQVSEVELGAPSGRIGQARRLKDDDKSAAPQHNDSDYVLIPRYDVRASAGSGTLPDDTPDETALAFQSSWARSISSGGIAALSVIQVEGDSMLPTLANGDHILIDTADRERLRDGIYVLRAEEALLVKRLSIHPSRNQITIASDNPAYASWVDCDPETIQIIGRVVWVGRQI